MSEKIVWFDLETGGTDPQKHPVIQFAGIATEFKHGHEFQHVEQLEIKIHFVQSACEPEALRLNSFDPDVWRREAAEGRSAARIIDKFVRRHATLPVPKKSAGYWMACQLAGHNAHSFDRPFLQAMFNNFGMFLPASYKVLDTLQLAMWWAQTLPPAERPKDHKLETLAEYFGVDPGGHDALADVAANIQVAEHILERLLRV